MQSRLYTAGWKLLDVLFPPSCAGCGSWGDRYCPTCFDQTRLVASPMCQICGDSLLQNRDGICLRCREQQMAYDAVRSWAYYTDPLQTAIHKLKYRQDRGLGECLAQPLAALYEKYRWKIDLIIPVPLDAARLRARGYNQAALLARPISWSTGISYSERVLTRIRSTRQQVGLSLSERAENMAGAFKAERGRAVGKGILVVDDVVTTGATLNACAHALKDEGASLVYGLTVARSTHTGSE